MAQVEIPIQLKVLLKEKLEENNRKFGFEISVDNFCAMAIRERMERCFTEPKKRK
tara:strand:+ start:772 stop:936 length:165 start_codon:yes stop_codon:yes gene_type:complete